MEPLLDQQNRKAALTFESNDHVDMIHNRRLNTFSQLTEQEQLGIRQDRQANRHRLLRYIGSIERYLSRPSKLSS